MFLWPFKIRAMKLGYVVFLEDLIASKRAADRDGPAEDRGGHRTREGVRHVGPGGRCGLSPGGVLHLLEPVHGPEF